jgi:hypothetical protein
MVKVNESVFVQPVAFSEEYVYTPFAVYIDPFHVYESQDVIAEFPFVEL